MLIKSLLFSLFIFCCRAVPAQDLTGTWEGSAGSGAGIWRISIVQAGDSCFGYSFDSIPGSCKANFSASFNRQNQQFRAQAISFIYRSFGHELISADLHYQKPDSVEYLTGSIRSRSFVSRLLTLGIGSRGVLRKISNQVDSTLFMKVALQRQDNKKRVPDAVISDQQAVGAVVEKSNGQKDKLVPGKMEADSMSAIKNSRTSLLAKTIVTRADSVTVILYDDGEIDCDMVSVFDNDQPVIHHLLLTRDPYRFTLQLPENGSKHVLELVVENEGSIPPNTAYMLVIAGTDRVEIKLSSNKFSNAAIRLQKIE